MSGNCLLSSNKYSVVNVLTNGLCRNHAKQVANNNVSWQGRVIHAIIATLEILPVIGLIVSVFDYSIGKLVHCCAKPKIKPTPAAPQQKKPNTETDLDLFNLEEINSTLSTTTNKPTPAAPQQKKPNTETDLYLFILEEIKSTLSTTTNKIKDTGDLLIFTADVYDAIKKYEERDIEGQRAKVDFSKVHFFIPNLPKLTSICDEILKDCLIELQNKNVIKSFEQDPVVRCMYIVKMA